jgi:WD40 repeat protein
VAFKFAPNDKFIAVVENGGCDGGKDAVCIYDCSDDWQAVSRFTSSSGEGDCAADVAGVEWNGMSDLIAVWSSPLRFLVHVHNVKGSVVFSFSAGGTSPNAGCCLGVHRVRWSPCGRLMAVSSHDSEIRLFNAINWSLVTSLSHRGTIDREDFRMRNCAVLEEKKVEERNTDAKIVSDWLRREQTAYEEVHIRPIALSRIKADPRKANPRVGVNEFSFSPDGVLLASKDDSMPSVIWIWDLQNVCLSALLVHQDAIASFQWEPLSSHASLSRLLMLTKAGRQLFAWTPFGAMVIQIPKTNCDFIPSRLSWNPRGKVAILAGRESFICCKT